MDKKSRREKPPDFQEKEKKKKRLLSNHQGGITPFVLEQFHSLEARPNLCFPDQAI